MEVRRPAFLPDPGTDREAMEALQREVAAAATFADDVPFDPAAVSVPRPYDEGAGDGASSTAEVTLERSAEADGPTAAPVVAGVDQAFPGESVVSAAVAMRGDAVVAEAEAVRRASVPYIPGLLSFREGPAVVTALEALSVEPDVLLVDGSGRIHYRQAGIATHVGVLFDVPAVGVAKSLLCGRPAASLEEPLEAGARVDVLADDRIDVPDGTVVGQAYQSRQFEGGNRHVNPLYVSPGHRLGVETATDLVAACCAGYKLPEPVRAADALADELARARR